MGRWWRAAVRVGMGIDKLAVMDGGIARSGGSSLRAGNWVV